MPATATKSTAAPPIVTRCLSVCEPWAAMIVGGPAPGEAWKPVENRTWKTDYRGTIAIHASTSKRHFTPEVELYLFDASPKLKARLCDENAYDHPFFYFGAIVGTVDIIGCVKFDPMNGDDDFERVCRAAGYGEFVDRCRDIPVSYWAQGDYCWLFDNPKQFTVPIPAKGALNLFRLAPSEIAAVGKAIRGPLGSPVDYRAKLAAAGCKLPALPPINEKLLTPRKRKSIDKPAGKAG